MPFLSSTGGVFGYAGSESYPVPIITYLSQNLNGTNIPNTGTDTSVPAASVYRLNALNGSKWTYTSGVLIATGISSVVADGTGSAITLPQLQNKLQSIELWVQYNGSTTFSQYLFDLRTAVGIYLLETYGSTASNGTDPNYPNIQVYINTPTNSYDFAYTSTATILSKISSTAKTQIVFVFSNMVTNVTPVLFSRYTRAQPAQVRFYECSIYNTALNINDVMYLYNTKK